MASRLSAGIVPIRIADEPQFLLLRAYTYWDFPKGQVEPGEDPLDAAKRELAEETSLSSVNFRWGKGFYETTPYANGKVARYYLGEVLSGDVVIRENPITQRAEHHEYRWLKYGEAKRLVVPRVLKVLDWATKKVMER